MSAFSAGGSINAGYDGHMLRIADSLCRRGPQAGVSTQWPELSGALSGESIKRDRYLTRIDRRFRALDVAVGGAVREGADPTSALILVTAWR
jgi:hypothetical protein